MTDIHVAIERLILHGPHQGVSRELAQRLGPLITARLEQLAAGAVDGARAPVTETQRIADRVAGEVWRTVEQARAVQHQEAT